MHGLMRFLFTALIMMLLVAMQGRYLQVGLAQTKATPMPPARLDGRWRVKFSFSGLDKNLIFDAQAKGSGSFLLLDTAPDDRPEAHPQPAAWSELTNDRVSFSAEVELPIGTCCREIGTLMFKGKFTSNTTVSGKLIFVTSVDEEESPYKFRSVIGTFTATRVHN